MKVIPEFPVRDIALPHFHAPNLSLSHRPVGEVFTELRPHR